MTSETRYKLLLISPKQKYINYPAHSELAKIFGKKRLMIPLALPIVAGITPDHYDIRIVDEETDPLPEDYTPDIVGISTLAATASRAFEISKIYRDKGIPVIFGGAYASNSTEDCFDHADSIIIGEAEGLWELCLKDFETGHLQKTYKSESFYEYLKPIKPRWDLINLDNIFQVAIQVSRGCPFNCEFCIVSKIFGRKMRYRDIDNVVEELSDLPTKYVFFVDDNLTINKTYAKELMQRIKPLGLSWGCMASIDVAKDEELLQLMAEAGCFNILIGFESLNEGSLEEVSKTHNRKAQIYEEAIEKIHKAGMHINASFIVGFDHDTLEEFDNIFNFTMKNALPNVNLHILGATPGTEMHARLMAEGRLYQKNPELGAGFFPIMHYMNMSQMDLFNKYMETIGKLYSWENIRFKAEQLFSKNSFTRPGSKIGFFKIIRVFGIVIKEFVFTGNSDKKKLFRFLIGLIRQKRIAPDRAFSFLISMLSNHRHILLHKNKMESYREIIRLSDKGPWKLMKKVS